MIFAILGAVSVSYSQVSQSANIGILYAAVAADLCGWKIHGNPDESYIIPDAFVFQFVHEDTWGVQLILSSKNLTLPNVSPTTNFSSLRLIEVAKMSR